ncbi:hypothetical protein BJY04DRAFT_215257 [Aspergillus karnatakaensis]|uniref:uncharacterized protein n=1 Tax=Aspergillus karnatakaensis TaxID=1810916 RepID=UPI003CCE3CFB
MPALWKSPWMRSKISLNDEQHDQLLPEKRDAGQLSVKEVLPQATAARERYVGFGIGGAGNIRKVKTRGGAATKETAERRIDETGMARVEG